ncbi:sulfite exporter TauE/SafE family protein [Actinomadura logoneensis]|uniref:sulfite exporter TauE/SafE family protein n=1 Tax=Actinomadura logoneensis TaxID=2293572 RepID=UPI001F389A1D|nr:sulfite exporter TauE/SafE family protein [Actinomadura logoneensis]
MLPSTTFLLVGGLAVLVGALVQSSIGFGVGVVATPVVALLFPDLMPGALLIAATVTPMFTLVREVRHADLGGLGWAFAGRLAGTPLGVWVVTVLSARGMSLAAGGLVLVALAVSAYSGTVPRNRTTLAAAGMFAGLGGTATAIGGPPIALLYQRESGPRVRATLAIFFTLGTLISVLTLAALDQFPQRQLVAGLALTPFVAAGFLAAGPLRRYLDGGRTRLAVLGLVGVSATVLIVRNLI